MQIPITTSNRLPHITYIRNTLFMNTMPIETTHTSRKKISRNLLMYMFNEPLISASFSSAPLSLSLSLFSPHALDDAHSQREQVTPRRWIMDAWGRRSTSWKIAPAWRGARGMWRGLTWGRLRTTFTFAYSACVPSWITRWACKRENRVLAFRAPSLSKSADWNAPISSARARAHFPLYLSLRQNRPCGARARASKGWLMDCWEFARARALKYMDRCSV